MQADAPELRSELKITAPSGEDIGRLAEAVGEKAGKVGCATRCESRWNHIMANMADN